MKVLRKLLFVILLSVLAKAAFSQDEFCIYIESRQHQPFYVRIGQETFSSSGNGFLLVPGLVNSTYELVIGFQGAKVKEWSFSCPVNNKDLGLVVEDRGNAGIRLSRLDQSTIFSGTAVKLQEEKMQLPPAVTGIISDDPFSTLLAEAVNDPTIRMPVIVAAAPAVPELAVQADTLKSLIAHQPAPEPGEGTATAVRTSTPQHNNTTELKPTEEKKAVADKTPATEKPGPLPAGKGLEPAVVETPPVEKAAEAPIQVNTASTSETKPSAKRKSAALPEEKMAASVTQVKSPVEEAGANAVSAPEKSAEVKYLPFVVKETPYTEIVQTNKTENVPKTAEPESTAAVKEKDREPVTKIGNKTTRDEKGEKQQAVPVVKAASETKENAPGYLPFVIQPGTGTDSATASQPDIQTVDDTTQQTGNPKTATAAEETLSPPKEEKPKPVFSNIRKTLERKGRDGIDLIYIDETSNGKKDTIRIFIPAPAPGK